jgi:hypothetical protein
MSAISSTIILLAAIFCAFAIPFLVVAIADAIEQGRKRRDSRSFMVDQRRRV